MSILLRVIGAVWILLTFRHVIQILRRLFLSGLNFHLGTSDLLYLLILAGAIGLLWLYEWGRWILLLGVSAFLLLQIGPQLLQFKITPLMIRHLVFYGIFIALLLLPQAKAATKR